MKIKIILFFILLSSINLTSMSWADEAQKQVDSTEMMSESEKMALYKRCEEDPDWCEKRRNAENSDEKICIENFTCEKTPIVEKTTQTTESAVIEEKWCTDNPEICKQLKANTEKLQDLQRQIDELHQALKSQKSDSQKAEEARTIEILVTDQ